MLATWGWGLSCPRGKGKGAGGGLLQLGPEPGREQLLRDQAGATSGGPGITAIPTLPACELVPPAHRPCLAHLAPELPKP